MVDTPPCINGLTKDNRTITTEQVIIKPTAGGNYTLTVTFRYLNKIEEIIKVKKHTTPMTFPGVEGYWSISNNVAGTTLINIGGGCTITCDITAIGY